MTRLRTILGTDTSQRAAQPPLRAELFLIGHDDATGRPHIDPDRLAPGLAAAILLELWLTRRIEIGWRYVARHGTYQADPGLITVRDPTPTGDPLTDAALAMLWHTGAPRTHDFIRDFAATGLYERVRGDMIASATLRRTTRRRFLFRRVESYTAVHEEQPVRARTKIRELATAWCVGPPQGRGVDTYHIALAALVTMCGLTRHLYLPEHSRNALEQALLMAVRSVPTIRDLVATPRPR